MEEARVRFPAGAFFGVCVVFDVHLSFLLPHSVLVSCVFMMLFISSMFESFFFCVLRDECGGLSVFFPRSHVLPVAPSLLSVGSLFVFSLFAVGFLCFELSSLICLFSRFFTWNPLVFPCFPLVSLC